MNFLSRAPLLLLSSLLLSGCLYSDLRSPRAYRSATARDVKSAPDDPRVTGRSCFQTALWLFAWGEGGYIGAVDDALKGRPDAVLYDVQTDRSVRSYLFGLYAKGCTIVTGRIGAL